MTRRNVSASNKTLFLCSYLAFIPYFVPALIFVLKLRFPPDFSLATLLKNVTTQALFLLCFYGFVTALSKTN